MCKLVRYFAILVHTKFNGLLVTWSELFKTEIRLKKYAVVIFLNVFTNHVSDHVCAHTWLIFN